ncbi:MAG TPA: acyl-CoA dehydrogenase, partial [Pseudolabrys sp.]
MTDRSFLKWPFLESRHRELAERLEMWAAANLAEIDHGDVDQACRRIVSVLGRDGWLKFSAPGDGEDERIDVRTLALIRETLARHSGLADFAF